MSAFTFVTHPDGSTVAYIDDWPFLIQTPATCGAVLPRDARTSSAPPPVTSSLPGQAGDSKQARPSPGG